MRAGPFGIPGSNPGRGAQFHSTLNLSLQIGFEPQVHAQKTKKCFLAPYATLQVFEIKDFSSYVTKTKKFLFVTIQVVALHFSPNSNPGPSTQFNTIFKQVLQKKIRTISTTTKYARNKNRRNILYRMKLKNIFKELFVIIFLFINKQFYGGQAVMNGVMMKGRNHYSISVNTSKGINTKTFKYTNWPKKYKLFSLPIIRGIVGFVEVIGIGYKSVNHSANIVLEDETGESSETSSALGFMMIATLFVSFLIAIFLFKFLPLGTATLINNLIPIPSILFNIIDGVVKIIIFVSYIYFIGRTPDIKELFRYHGGEHKTINCYENKQKLTIKNILSNSQVHLRCGTTFLFVVLFFSMVVYLFIPKTLPFGYNLLLRLALLPLIAGISYEVQQLYARKGYKIIKPLIIPGLWLQALTVNSPGPKHARAAKTALETLIKTETGKEKEKNAQKLN